MATPTTPVGPLLLAATERGLVRTAYAREDHEEVPADLAGRLGPRVLRGDGGLGGYIGGPAAQSALLGLEAAA